MDKDIKRLLGVLGVAAIIFIVSRPKGFFTKKSKPKDLSTPSEADNSDLDFENSITAIQAMRMAINENAPSPELEDLNNNLHEDYGFKVYMNQQTGKLYTAKDNGDPIAEEK